MSETTSPRVTIFATFRSPLRFDERLDPHLAEGPYLLVGEAGLPQGRDDFAFEVRYVAGDQARLPLGDETDLPDGGRQYARLGAFESLGPSRVLDPDRVPHAREGETAFGVDQLRVRLGQRPTFEGEVRSGAADDAAVRPIHQRQPRVRAGQVVGLELVEGGVYVGVPLLLAQAVAVEVLGHHELAEVRGLLDLEDQGVRPEGVDDPARHVDGVPRPYRMTRHHGVVVPRLERFEELLARQALFDPGQDRRSFGGPEDVPRLGLAVWLAVLFLGGLVVGVEVDGEHVRGVEELLEEREVRAAPVLPDELLGELGDEVVERLSGVLAVGNSSRSVPVVAYLPGLGNDAVWCVPLAEELGDQTLPEVVGAHVVGHLYRVRVHPSSSTVTSKVLLRPAASSLAAFYPRS